MHRAPWSQLETLKPGTERANAVVDAAPDTEGAVNDALLRLTQEKLFLILRDFEVDAKRVKKTDITFLAKAVAELGCSPGIQNQWADKLRSRAEKAADEAAAIVRKGGLSDAGAEEIRRKVLGVAS
jgi:hypothetical protein